MNLDVSTFASLEVDRGFADSDRIRSLSTRLETRTKESNIYASVLVEKPTRIMKVSDAKRKQQHRPTMILR